MSYVADGLVGKLAVQKGFLTAAQLKECLAEQTAHEKAGRKRPLGVILVSRGFLKDEDLLELLEEQKRYLAERSNYAQVRKDDFLFGQILIKQGVAGPEEVNRALRTQAEAAERGELPVPRLGQILMEMGVSDEKKIQETLRLQYKTLYECPGCGLKYNLVQTDPRRQYRCRKCGAILGPKPPGSGVKADQSAYGMNLEVASDLPPEVAQAELDPANVFGGYVLLEELGRGGMGTVFRAYQKELKRTVALKILRGGDEETRQRFANEGQLAARLKHPNIVSLYEIGRAHNVPFLAMEYVEGKSLDDLGELPLRKAVALLRDVAQAVHYAHERGVLHRDLKPQNILVDKDGRPYVTDFGLAREVEGWKNLTLTGIVVGTPSYMSAEQARGDRDLDGRSDVAALGSVLYEAAAGRTPFAGPTQIDVALAVIHQEPIPPRRLRSSVPADLEAVILKAMAKDRNLRYGSARELAEDLQRFLEGEPVLARRPNRVAATVRRITRHKKRSALAVASVLAAAILLGVLSSSLRENREQRRLLRAAAHEKAGELEQALALYAAHPSSSADAGRVRAALESRRARDRAAEARREAERLLAGAGPGAPPDLRARLATEALSLVPDLETAFVVRASAHQEMGHEEAAYEDLGRAADRSSTPLPHLMARADLARRLGRVPDEIADLSRAIELNPFSGDLRLYRAWARARLARERLPGAAADVVKLVVAAEEDLSRAGRHALLAGVETLVRDLRADMARAPAPARREFSAAYADEAWAALAAGREPAAPGAWAERAVDSDPGYAPAFVARGACRLVAGRAAEARSDAEWALQLLPRLPEALALRGLSRIHQAVRDAIEAPAAAVPAEPSWAAEYADGWAEVQDYLVRAPRKAAYPALERMVGQADLALQGRETLSLFLSGRLARRAAALRVKRDFAAAVGLLDRAVTLAPSNVSPYLERAECRFQAENFGAALSDWQRAVSLDPSLRGDLDSRMREARTRLGGG